MPGFLLISDVFCPWCFGFGPVFARLHSEHPDFPVRLLAGSLVETPVTVAQMKERSPNIRDFFLRLEKTTGRSAAGFIRLLDENSTIRLHSTESTRLLLAMQRFAPRTERQMDALQTALYAEGKDVLNPDVLRTLLPDLGIDAERCLALLDDPALQQEAAEEMRTALDILDEFPVYPTLFLETEKERIPLTRGYAPYATVRSRLDAALEGMKEKTDYTEGAFCGLDGKCC